MKKRIITDSLKRKIVFLRNNGWDYVNIEKFLKLSQGYLTEFYDDNTKEQVVISKKLVNEITKEITQKFCLSCGVELIQNHVGRRKKFCSERCKDKWDYKHREIYKLKCIYCGKDFKSLGVKDRKYCCHTCYIKDRFWLEEDVSVIFDNIKNNEQIEFIPKWVKETLLSNKDK